MQPHAGIGTGDLRSRLQAAETRLVDARQTGPHVDRAQVNENQESAANEHNLKDPANRTSNGQVHQSLSAAAPNHSRLTASASVSGESSSTPGDHEQLFQELMLNENLLVQLHEQEAATKQARDDSAEAAAALKVAEAAKEDLCLDLTHSREEANDLRDQLTDIKAVQALQRGMFASQSNDDQDMKSAVDETKELMSISDMVLRERAGLVKEAKGLLRSSGLTKRQAAMNIIAEVRAAEFTLQDATTRLRLLLKGVVQMSSSSAPVAMQARAVPQHRLPDSARLSRGLVVHKLSSRRLDSIFEDARIETQSTASLSVIEASSNCSALGDVDDSGPDEAAASHTSSLVLAAVAQQLREHSQEASRVRQEAREIAEKMGQDMAKQKTDASDRHEEMVASLAIAQCQAERLQGKLESKDAIIERYSFEAKDHQSKMQSKDNARMEAERKLEEQLVVWEEQQNVQEDLHEQLLAAMQSSKLACGRVEDFRQEIKSQKARHARKVDTLERELSIARATQAPAGDQGSSSASILLDLVQQVRHLTEERGELQNMLEWREIQWRTKVEDLEAQLAMQRRATVAA